MGKTYDVVIIGGGFYGSFLAYFLSGFFKDILIVESEKDLLMRASLHNQGRVHNGYHYPRSFLTAYRSHINFNKFTKEFSESINTKIKKYYALPKYNNKISPRQFVSFCKRVGIPTKSAVGNIKNFFDKRLISEVFEVEEFIFDPNLLRVLLKEKLLSKGVDILYETTAKKVEYDKELLQIETDKNVITARIVFNCTYSQINAINKNSHLSKLPFKYEMAEMVVIEMPEALKNYGITLIDGPFFSVLPYANSAYHILSHVRFTPQYSWSDKTSEQFIKQSTLSQAQYIMKDSQRFLPVLRESKYIKSIYEIKTVLLSNEDNDGRPILFRKDFDLKNYHVIMGGKIDNIYDILQTIQQTDIISRFQ